MKIIPFVFKYLEEERPDLVRGSGLDAEAVARTANRDEMPGVIRILFERLPESSEEVVGRARLRQEAESPDFLQQLLARNDRALGVDQVERELELERRKLDP